MSSFQDDPSKEGSSLPTVLLRVWTVDRRIIMFAAQYRVPWIVILWSGIRTFFLFIGSENMLWWKYTKGRRNGGADHIGPAYILGAPNRNVADGKAVMAAYDQLKAFVPYLLTLRITDSSGHAIPNAKVDFWQADSEGNYSVTEYALRGRFETDIDGRVEVLTVPPGKYGPMNHYRAGHFHMTVGPPRGLKGRWDEVTTQLYCCPRNDFQDTSFDFLNWFRPPRAGNLLKSWSAAGDDGVMGFPPLADEEVKKRAGWWDSKFEAAGHGELKVRAGAEYTLALNGETNTWL